jgi:DNA invertase Pin-like site-specific DNA recombinase
MPVQLDLRSASDELGPFDVGAHKLVFFSALAEFERDLINERTAAGLAAAAARGRKGGRKPVVTAEKLGSSISTPIRTRFRTTASLNSPTSTCAGS